MFVAIINQSYDQEAASYKAGNGRSHKVEEAIVGFVKQKMKQMKVSISKLYDGWKKEVTRYDVDNDGKLSSEELAK